LEEEIKAFKSKVKSLRKSQQFTSNHNDDLTKSYKSALLTNKQHKQDINRLNKRPDDLQKQSSEDELKIDELEQYDRRQNLEIQGVPETADEDVTQITMELVKSLDIELDAEDISIAHRLPKKQRFGKTRSSTVDNKHPIIIVRFVSRMKRNEIYANRIKAKNIKELFVGSIEDPLY